MKPFEIFQTGEETANTGETKIEKELSPQDQEIFDYVVGKLDDSENKKIEKSESLKLDDQEGFMTKLGKAFGGLKSRLMLIGTLLGAGAGVTLAQENSFDELHSRIQAEKTEGPAEARMDEQFKRMSEDLAKQEKNMKEVFGKNIDLSGGKQEKQEKINIDIDGFFHAQFPNAKEIKVVKQGNDYVINVDGKIYVGSAETGADGDLAREKAENSADGARAQFLAGNFGKTESFSLINMSGRGAPIERVSEGKDGYTAFVFYQVSGK